MSDVEKMDEFIKIALTPFLAQVRKDGLVSTIERLLPGFYVGDFFIKKIKNSLRTFKTLDLGKFLGKMNIYYKNNAVYMDCVGLINLFINRIVIPNDKIVETLEDIFSQIEEIFFKDENYIIGKTSEILKTLANKEIFVTSNLEEKSLYDLILFVFISYHDFVGTELPEWIVLALKNVDKSEFAKDFLDFFIEVVIRISEGISKKVYIKYDIVLESKILRFFLNKNTNSGKISDVMSFFGLDLRDIINGFVKKYAGATFLKGLGEHLCLIIQSLIFGVADNSSVKNRRNKFNFTSCAGKSLNSRRFRWFGDDEIDEYLEISEDENFINSVSIKAKKEKVTLSRPTIFDLGAVAKHQIETRVKYSASLSNFEFDKRYFIRIRRRGGDYANSFLIKNSNYNHFVVMSDSQGMVQKDYNKFLRAFESFFEKISNIQFVSHLGDFVDDGINENFWDFLLDSKIWAKIPVFPITGNHEVKFHPTLKQAGIKNSIINHFNVEFENEDHLYEGIYYSFEQNNCIFVFLNTNLGHEGLGKNQLKWIYKTFEKSSAKWKILFTHKTPYSNGPHNDDVDVEVLKKDINELCLKFGIDIVFGGHDHVYSRTKPMCFGKATDEITKNGKIINPSGTIFVTLGPAGVKNYKIHENKKTPNEIILDLTEPSFANVVTSENEIKVEICKFLGNGHFDIVDRFCIVKSEKYESTEQIERYINNLPVIPWVRLDERCKCILKKYNNLKIEDRRKIKSISKLNSIIRFNLVQKNISEGNISIVFNKREFLDAVNDPEVRTIIVEGDMIKFENKFGLGRKIKINRDLVIKGNAKLKFVSFVIKPNVTLYLGGSVMIDNNRKKFSIYPSICSFVMRDNSNLVFQNNSWVEQSYGIGMKGKYIIKSSGDNVNIFTNSENFKKIPKNFISKKFWNRIFNIFE